MKSMTSLHIKDSDIPILTGKVAVVTGGSSGIGLATARILAERGATVHVLDLEPIRDDDAQEPEPESETGPSLRSPAAATVKSGLILYTHCDVTSWPSLLTGFEQIGHIDIAVANAGVSQECDYFADTFDAKGQLEEPRYNVVNVNYRAVLNFVKLSLRAFRLQAASGGGIDGGGGPSLVITSSATAYSPEQSLPVYSATKLAVSFESQLPKPFPNSFSGQLPHDLIRSSQDTNTYRAHKLIGLVRALRSTIHLSTNGATINAVAPAATITRLLPSDLAAPILAAGAPVSSAHHVGLAIAYSATATQDHAVERYGKDSDEKLNNTGRWNGRCILTLGDTWVEVEETLAKLKEHWMGEWQAEMTAFQQQLTDFRPE